MCKYLYVREKEIISYIIILSNEINIKRVLHIAYIFIVVLIFNTYSQANKY